MAVAFKSVISFGLVSIPLDMYTATQDKVFEDYIKVVFKLNTIVFLDGGDDRAKSEHVYFVNGMLVLLLTLASQNRK